MPRRYTSGSAKRQVSSGSRVDYVRNRLESRQQYGAAVVLDRSHKMAQKGLKVGRDAVQMFLSAFQYHPISVHSVSEFGMSVRLKELVARASSSDHNICYEALL